MNNLLNKKPLIIALCIFIPPLGLYLLWKKDTQTWKKIIVTPFSVFCFLLIIVLYRNTNMTDEEKAKYRQKREREELADQNLRNKNRFGEELNNLEGYDNSYETRKLQIATLEKNRIYRDIVINEIVNTKYLRYLSILNEYHINLTATDNNNTTELQYNSSISNESYDFVNSSKENKEFFNYNYELLKEISFSKGIILAFIRYAEKYGYYGGNSNIYNANGDRADEIDFNFNLIPTIIKYAPKDKELLDIFCESYQDGYSELDNRKHYVHPWFRNINNFNKYLKFNYSDCDCYIDHDKIKKEKQEDFEDDCLSSIDGSCREFVNITKNRMNDPDSFEHVKTVYRGYGSYVIITMSYRGKNGFGAKILGSTSAKASWDCEILEILE